MLSEDEEDIIIADAVCRAFEEASGAILNRNRKTVILGLGSWEGRQEWPLPWLQAVQHTKVYGVLVGPQFSVTIAASWDFVIGGIEKVLRELTARRLPTLRQRAAALEPSRCPRPGTLPKFFPSPPPPPLASAVRWATSCGEAASSALPLRSSTSPSLRAASACPPSPPGPTRSWPSRLATALLGGVALPATWPTGLVSG
jgi:hypothetical protein